jgi:DNA replication protein DnaC
LTAVADFRRHGRHSSHPVLITGAVGTGKTWLMQQAMYLLCNPVRCLFSNPDLLSRMQVNRTLLGLKP